MTYRGKADQETEDWLRRHIGSGLVMFGQKRHTNSEANLKSANQAINNESEDNQLSAQSVARYQHQNAPLAKLSKK